MNIYVNKILIFPVNLSFVTGHPNPEFRRAEERLYFLLYVTYLCTALYFQVRYKQ
jgi:hypothetical protein